MVSYQIIRPVKMQVPVSLPAFAWRTKKKHQLYILKNKKKHHGVLFQRKIKILIFQGPCYFKNIAQSGNYWDMCAQKWKAYTDITTVDIFIKTVTEWKMETIMAKYSPQTTEIIQKLRSVQTKVDDKKHITELHLSIGATGAPAPWQASGFYIWTLPCHKTW